LTQVETFRVGCIGAIGDAEMKEAVAAIASIVQEMGITQLKPAAARAAA
jgi:2-aminoethylphosphonate-pyruvate transaminase